MDQIKISEMAILFQVGVPEAERALPQKLLVDVDLDQDFGAASRTDSLRNTIDYDALRKRLIRFSQGRSWALIETLAVDLAELILKEFGPVRVTIEIKKFALPETGYVSVRVTRP